MANNAHIAFPDIVGIGDPNDGPAGPASFNPGPGVQQPMRNVPPRTTRLQQKQDQMVNQQYINGPTSPQQLNRKGNNNMQGGQRMYN